MRDFFAELKRRHIYRVGAAYAVVAWGVLQLVNNLAPALKLPDWALTLIVVLLAIGFPITLIFAWVHELKTDENAPSATNAANSKTDYVLVGVLSLLIVLIAYQQLGLQPGGSYRQTLSLGSISIAVLPFANVSADTAEDFFSDGITDEVASALAKVPDLHIVARSSAFEFKGQNKAARAVGEALGASHLIEGSVRRAGDRVRITAQLVRADSGLQLWSENFDRQLTDIFAIQEDIAKAIAAALRVPLGLAQGDTLVRSRTKDDATYEDYLRAKALVRARGYARLNEGIKLLEQVVAREPDYAPAWALLSLAYGYVPFFHPAYYSGASDPLRPIVEATVPKAEAAARRSIEIDPKSPEGYLALAIIQGTHEKYLLAREPLARALALDPDNPEVLYLNALMLADLGYVKQAQPVVRRLRAVEPFVPVYNSLAAGIMWLDGQTDESIAILKPLAAGSGLGQGGIGLARIYAAEGRYADAADVLQSTPAGIYLPGTLEAAAGLLRGVPAASAPQPLPSLGSLSWVSLYSETADHVLDYKDDMHSISLWAPTYPYWAQAYGALRKTERFKALLRDTEIVEYWREHGWPDLCRPQGADDFACD